MDVLNWKVLAVVVLLFAIVAAGAGRAAAPPKPKGALQDFRERRAKWRSAVRMLVLQSEGISARANEWESPLSVDDVRKLVTRTTGQMRRSAQQVWNMEPTAKAAAERQGVPLGWDDAMAWLDAAKRQLKKSGQWAAVVDLAELPLDPNSPTGDRKAWRKVMFHWGDLVCLWDVDFLTRDQACKLLVKARAQIDAGVLGREDIADGHLKSVVAAGFPVYGPPP